MVEEKIKHEFDRRRNLYIASSFENCFAGNVTKIELVTREEGRVKSRWVNFDVFCFLLKKKILMGMME